MPIFIDPPGSFCFPLCVNRSSNCLLTTFLITTAFCAPPPSPDLIIHGGEVVTMSAENEPAPEAVLIRDGRIAHVGKAADILALGDERTRVLDLNGRVLLPGFIASHTHPELSAYLHAFVDLSGFRHRRPEQVWSALREAVAGAEPGQWIFCKGFDPMLVPGLKAPTIQELDRIAPENPVVIVAQSLHSAWANSRGFAAMGITADTPDAGPGSYYEKDAQGRLTGLIVEVAAMEPIQKVALGQIDIKAGMQAVMREYAANGITSIATAGLFAKDSRPLLLLEHLSTRSPGFKHHALELIGLLPRRVPTVRNFVYIKGDTPFLLPDSTDNGDDFFRIVGVKLWYDGSPYIGSMYLEEPYLDSELTREGLKVPPGSRGKSVLPREEFREQIRAYHEQGWQLAIHSQGDAAAREVVAELGAMLDEAPRKDHRHRLEHGLLIPGELMQTIQARGLTPSLHVNHLYYYGEALRDGILGPARAARILPAASARAANVVVTLHADQPMYPEDPLSLMATAVTRTTRNGNSLSGAEALSALEALRTLTIDGAWQLKMEDSLGSIEVGKYADLVVLDRNPLRVEPARLREIQVERTFVAGEEIWAREP